MIPPTLSLYCDGSAHDVRGQAGGWAFAIIEEGSCRLARSGGLRVTDNNTMELRAAVAALTLVLERGWQRSFAIELVSDSRVTLEVALGTRTPVKSAELARSLRSAFLECEAVVRWVRAHSGEPWNEYVDALAHQAKERLVPPGVKEKRASRRLARQAAGRKH